MIGIFRTHPFLSLPGFLTLVIFSLGLGASIWWKGSTLLSPGDLTEQGRVDRITSEFSSHADFEEQCERCHTPFGAPQTDLCVQCHTEIKDQINSQSGTHAKLVSTQQCRNCHPDHLGRGFDITEAAFSLFDHTQTSFSLVLHEYDYEDKPIACYDCHIQENGFQVNIMACETCHTEFDPAFMMEHNQTAGKDCLKCHDGLDSLSDFDHAGVLFPLEGMHAQAACVDCHPGFVFQDAPLECLECHTEPSSHTDRFPADCQLCHTPHTWLEVQFDHSSTTMDCIICHEVDTPPDHFGDQCAACHSTDAWIPASFDHQLLEVPDCLACHLADRPAEHFEGQCSLCHSTIKWEDAVFDHTNQTDCQSCHLADKPDRHFPGQCSICHVPDNWGDVSFNHAGFPDCIACHLNDRPSDHDDGQCSQCHNTIDWDDAVDTDGAVDAVDDDHDDD